MKNNYLLTYFKAGLMLLFLCFTAVPAVAQVIGTQPISHTVTAAKPTSFSITTIGNGSFNYLWVVSTNGGNSFVPLSNGGIYSGVNTTTLNISKTTVSMNGYQYKVVLTGLSIGVAESNIATLTTTVPSLEGNHSWIAVGGSNISELRAQSTSIAIDPAGTPYIAYRRNEDQKYFAVVKKFNGTTWETLPTDGLTTDWVNQPVIATNSVGVPYLSYSNLLTYKGMVKKFNGADWETLGNSSFSGGEIGFLSFSFDNLDTPNAVYYDNQLGYKGTAKKFNGTSWVQVGSPIFSNGTAFYFSTAFDSSNTEYVAYRDEGNGGKARVIKFNGTNWENVGTPDISAGIVHSTTVAIDAADTVYLSYKDEVNGDKIRVLKFNGTDWVPVGAAFVSDIVTQYSRLVLDPAGTPYIHAHTSDFKNLLFKFDGTDWQKLKTDNIISISYGSLAFNPEGIPYISYDDRQTGKANVVKYDLDIPVITSQPINSMVTGGRGVNFSATVTGGSLSYQWQVSTDGGTTFTSIVDGATYGDVTKAKMYINNAPISMNNYQYRLVVNNGVEVISRAAVLNVESPEYNTTREWHLVGTQGFSNASLNDAPSMSIDQMGRPNVGYVDLSTGGKISVQRFENTTWETLGETTATTHSANFPSMKCDIFGKPYIAYQDIALGGKASVVRHDGRNWITIGDAGFSNGRISSITSAAASNGVPFVAYADSSNGNKVTIKKFNGSSWENIGNPSFTNNEVKNISLAIDFWGIPSIAYQDADNDEKITVKKFDGTNWTDVGNPGFSDTKADNITLAIDAASLPYVVYQDSDSNNNPKINVKRLNGTTWENVGNTLPAVKIQHLSFVLDKSGTPFIGYNDYNDNLKTTVKRLINGNWENVGSSSFSEGATSFPTLVVSQVGVPYMAYADATKENKLTVMQYNMALTISQKNVTCAGDNNGSATVTVTGGQEPFYYEWSSNDSESDEDQPDEVSGLTKGTYSVTVTDYDGTQVKKTFVITEPEPLTVTKLQTNVSCNGNILGTATANVTGGTGTYTYEWSPSGGTEATATGLTVGDYTVTVKDANGCSIEEDFTITTISDVIAPVPDVKALPAITNYCAVLSAEIAIPTATDNCNGTIIGTTTDPLNYTTSGSYTITWNFIDDSGNNATQKQTINVMALYLDQVSFSNKEFTYDGNLHEIKIDNLPPGAIATYTTTPATGSANGVTNTGTYSVTATITPATKISNCPPLVLTAGIKINKASQQITFDTLPTKNIGNENDFQLEAQSNSGLPVYYTFNYTSALAPADVSSAGLVRLLQSGELTITAHQDGNENYLPAATVSQLLIIKSGSASISQITIGNQSFENPQQEITHLLDCGQSNPTIAIQTENNSSIVLPANTFTIQTPKVGIYKQDVTVTSQDGTIIKNYVIIVEKRFNFFDIVQQKFNNVLLVNNNSQTNGGYEFVSYQWFKNGQLIGTDQYYSAGDNVTDILDASAAYSVKMTTKDGLVLQTCNAAIQKLNSYQARLYPNPTQAGQAITIDADYPEQELQKMRINIYTISGSLIQTIESSTAKTQIQLPPTLQNGTYIVVLETSSSKKSFKVIVNK